MKNKISFQSFFDSISKAIFDPEDAKEHKLSPQKKAHQLEIENAILVLAAAVIRCNQNYTEGTQKFITEFIQKQFGDKALTKRIKAVANHLEIGTEPYTKIACKELKMLTTLDSRESVLRFLFGVAIADDFLNVKETKCLNRIADYLGIDASFFLKIKQQFLNSNSPYSFLGIDETATLEEVKAAYRKMVLKHHPDKRDAGVSEEDANIKFREIQRAFEIISTEKAG